MSYIQHREELWEAPASAINSQTIVPRHPSTSIACRASQLPGGIGVMCIGKNFLIGKTQVRENLK